MDINRGSLAGHIISELVGRLLDYAGENLTEWKLIKCSVELGFVNSTLHDLYLIAARQLRDGSLLGRPLKIGDPVCYPDVLSEFSNWRIRDAYRLWIAGKDDGYKMYVVPSVGHAERPIPNFKLPELICNKALNDEWESFLTQKPDLRAETLRCILDRLSWPAHAP